MRQLREADKGLPLRKSGHAAGSDGGTTFIGTAGHSGRTQASVVTTDLRGGELLAGPWARFQVAEADERALMQHRRVLGPGLRPRDPARGVGRGHHRGPSLRRGRPAVVVGNSMGARAAVIAAAHRPDLRPVRPQGQDRRDAVAPQPARRACRCRADVRVTIQHDHELGYRGHGEDQPPVPAACLAGRSGMAPSPAPAGT
jgi:hypothetical protein